MHNDAEAQEIQGTVVSSGHFAEPAAEDRAKPSEAAGQDAVIDPDGQIGQAGEADDVTDPGDQPGPVDYGTDDEAIDPDGVIIDETIIDETPARDETSRPSPVAGFARTPLASDEAAGAGPGATAPDAAAADADTTRAGTAPAAAQPGPAIPEAVRPGLPGDGDGRAMNGLPGAAEQLHERWSAIQSSFVDDPRASVAAAAELVNQAIATLVASAQERERGLRGEWDRDGVDTEGLRNALRNYRGLLDHLAGL
ncbi:MAG TPA: hypothetical protein VMI33_09720 [Streptosporangiaceae bacterium]|nr:hypothetical protein [Streptosporangiaceae bacterium]